MYRVIVAGGRDFNRYAILKAALDELLSDLIESGEEIRIVSGKARGADRLGERYAKERGFEVDPYPADWKRQADGSYDASAGYKRNAEMADNAEACICFYNGSKGTGHMIDLAKKKGISLVVLDYNGLEIERWT
ncbi:DUF2493 domain-containing protein [Heyndrickxia sporothermodurans]|uniref:DUF2493 domain-containing protein n=1 Tax=Heyndrickxia sporothermodurans TaxID=46224 RepID=UPI000D3DB7E2|nr:DUF2493 domain-containing protein [Heyndrickxia sporothermodurans]PTY92950.1 hypothetical protein B5V90_02400 [Heyndrickxia sporothermodurans]